MSPRTFDFVVVGAGIVGAATAYKLQLKYPKKSIAILEKEPGIGRHQTGRNSGVIHSGIYYTPGSFKAKNCKDGREQLINFAKQYNIPYDICGKIIVATNPDEIPALEDIYNRGVQNKTPGIKYVDQDEIKTIEPFIKGVKGIHVPSAGIIDYVKVNCQLADLVSELNPDSKLFLNCEYVSSITKENKLEIHTNQGVFITDKVIFCAGLQSDRLIEENTDNENLKIVGFRGDYYKFITEKQFKVNNLVYPVPDPKFPFLGVHFTKMIDGSVECGPNAVFTFAREKYKKTSFNFRDTVESLSFTGTWALFRKFWRQGLGEYRRAFSKTQFVKELQKLMPELEKDDLIVTKSGIRAQVVNGKGEMIDDFKIIVKGQKIHVLNAPSPAATACLSIADEIVNEVVKS